MAEMHNEIGEPELTADDAVKQRLLGRIAVAAVIIVGLLGSLAMFDALYAPKPVLPGPVATVTPPVETKAPAAPETTPAPATPATPAATAATATSPEVTTSAPAEPLAPLPNERLTKPATPQKALAHPPGSLSSPTAAELQREMQRGAQQAAPQGTARTPATAAPAPSKPISQPPQGATEVSKAPAATQPSSLPVATVVPPKPAPITTLLPPDQSARQFALQLGVFSNFANAEELRSKLEAAGIPTTVEARVRAGPFATRGEADAARAKLRALGIEESIMVSVKR